MDEPYDIREVAAQFCAASRTFYGISGIHVSQRHHRKSNTPLRYLNPIYRPSTPVAVSNSPFKRRCLLFEPTCC